MKKNGNGNRSRTAVLEARDVGMDDELHELFLNELADLLTAEVQLTKALPTMARAAHSEELAHAFKTHAEETENHVRRLKEVFESLNEKAKNKTCPAMRGLIEEISEQIKDLKGSSTLDAGLIAAAQKVKHYEIASYGSLRAWAEQMGHTEALKLLEETLEEEKMTDDKLTAIAENSGNRPWP